MNTLKNIYNKITYFESEQNKIIQLVQQFATKETKIVDMGCGYGRLLSPLQDLGYTVKGVEINQAIVEANQQKGLNCVNSAEFEADESPVQMMILSHIIEHFTPADLFAFLNQCLSKLAPNGFLIIATPLYSHYFYDDFDHVKPYHPAGIQMVFGGSEAQVQYYSPYRLSLKDLWFRRSAFFSTLRKTSYLKTPFTRIYQMLDFFMALLYRLSGGWIGRKDGWVGVFQKC